MATINILNSGLYGVTGVGNFVGSNSPTLITPTLGAATVTSINKLTITQPATGSTFTLADGKTLTVNNTLTFSGTDGSTVNFGAGGTAQYSATTSITSVSMRIFTSSGTYTPTSGMLYCLVECVGGGGGGGGASGGASQSAGASGGGGGGYATS